MNKVAHMSVHQKECQDCGWRGTAAELDETEEAAGGKTHIFCPDCGGEDIKDWNPDEEGETTGS